MTVSSTLRKAGPYVGNGVTTQFPFSFKVFTDADIAVIVTDSSNGAAVTLTLDSDYTVLLNPDQDAVPGGVITYPILVGPAPLPATSTLTMIGDLAYDHETDITNAGRFLPQVIENSLDKLTILVQQLKEISGRTLQAAVGTTVSLLFPAPSSGKFIRWRTDLLGLENADAGTDSMALQGLLADGADPSHGSFMVGFLQAGAGAVPRTVQAELREKMVSAKGFGVVGNGVVDDTINFQKFLDVAGMLYVPAGTYIDNPLTVRSNTTIFLAPGALIKAKTGYGVNDRLLNIINVSNVAIFGNFATIQMLKAEYLVDEQRHCVNISGATNVAIYDLIAKDSGGDGFYIGGASNTPSRNVRLQNCVGDNNRRQGLSIANVIGCTISGGEYKNTIGTAPACGIDVESNPFPGYYLEDVNITGVKTFNNDGGGITVSPLAEGNPISVTVKNCTSEYDGDRGAFSAAGSKPLTKIQGFVLFEDCLALRPQVSGISNGDWSTLGPSVIFRRIKLIDVASNAAKAIIQQRQSGIIIRVEPVAASGRSYGGVSFDDIEVVETRIPAKTNIPVFLNNAQASPPTEPLQNIRFKNIRHSGTPWLNASTTPFVMGAGPYSDIKNEYANDFRVTIGSHTVQLSEMGSIISSSGTSTYTLPNASSVLGLELSFEVLVAGTISLALGDVTDIMPPISLVTGKGIRSNVVGSFATVRAEGGRWRCISLVGTWTQIP